MLDIAVTPILAMVEAQHGLQDLGRSGRQWCQQLAAAKVQGRHEVAWTHPCRHHRDYGAGELQPRLPQQFLQTEMLAERCPAGLRATPMAVLRSMAGRAATALRMPLPFVACRAFVPAWRKSKGLLGAGILHHALRNYHGEAGHVAEGLQELQSLVLLRPLLLYLAKQLLQLRPRMKLALE